MMYYMILHKARPVEEDMDVLAKEFQSLDLNGDGKISAEELALSRVLIVNF